MVAPHNGGIITLFVVTGLTHKQSYRDIFSHYKNLSKFYWDRGIWLTRYCLDTYELEIHQNINRPDMKVQGNIILEFLGNIGNSLADLLMCRQNY